MKYLKETVNSLLMKKGNERNMDTKMLNFLAENATKFPPTSRKQKRFMARVISRKMTEMRLMGAFDAGRRRRRKNVWAEKTRYLDSEACLPETTSPEYHTYAATAAAETSEAEEYDPLSELLCPTFKNFY